MEFRYRQTHGYVHSHDLNYHGPLIAAHAYYNPTFRNILPILPTTIYIMPCRRRAHHAPTCSEGSPGGWTSTGTAPVGLEVELALELLPVLSVGLGVRTRSGIFRRGFA